MDNRVLTLDEILTQPDGEMFCAELRKPCEFMQGGQFGDCFKDERDGRPVLHDPYYCPAFLDRPETWNRAADGTIILRIWLFNREPTAEELAVNPWPDQGATP